MTRPPLASARVTAILAALGAVTPLSIDIALPALPAIAKSLEADAGASQLTMGLFLVGFGLSQAYYGPLSDRYGRRPVLLAALCLYLAASVACIFAPSIEFLIAARFVQGAGAGAGMVLARACARDIHGPEMARVMSLIVTGASLAPLLAPILGGAILAVADWRWTFVGLAVSGVLLLGVVALWLDESNANKVPGAARPGPMLRNFAGLLGDRHFRGYAIVIACTYGALFALISEISFILVGSLGASPTEVGLGFSLVMVGQISGALLSTRIAVRRGPMAMMGAGLGFMAVGSLVLIGLAIAGIATFAAIIAPLAVFMFGFGQSSPSIFTGALAPYGQNAGAASSLAGVIQWISGAAFGAASVALHDGTALPMGLLMIGLVAGAAVALVFLVRPQTRRAVG